MSTVHQESKISSKEIIDLTNNKDCEYVIAKIPVELYNKILNENTEKKQKIIKGTWSEEEDKMLLELVKKYGPKRWSFIAKQLKGGRVGKQCRERWMNHLNPTINKRQWTPEEDRLIIHLHNIYGNQWFVLK